MNNVATDTVAKTRLPLRICYGIVTGSANHESKYTLTRKRMRVGTSTWHAHANSPESPLCLSLSLSLSLSLWLHSVILSFHLGVFPCPTGPAIYLFVLSTQ